MHDGLLEGCRHGQKTGFEAYSRRYNPFFSFLLRKNGKKFREVGGRRFAELRDPSLYCLHNITVETELPVRTKLKKINRAEQWVVKTLSSKSNKHVE